ncbi:Os04g0296167 [Oryza sativa Japonica Group]|uniref:Uncharacterized protein n=2 Tax=Oryza sativa subsp. japonica TaxID=39947 RepID=A0A8J8XAC0_ORYSJ|nr:hypothetical protein OsJ_14184 [Oryza sativa Japonica Group]BAS88447.1 Os04g0296167 [Oryza sativa Japonica Group]
MPFPPQHPPPLPAAAAAAVARLRRPHRRRFLASRPHSSHRLGSRLTVAVDSSPTATPAAAPTVTALAVTIAAAASPPAPASLAARRCRHLPPLAAVITTNRRQPAVDHIWSPLQTPTSRSCHHPPPPPSFPAAGCCSPISGRPRRRSGHSRCCFERCPQPPGAGGGEAGEEALKGKKAATASPPELPGEDDARGEVFL